MNNHSIIIIYIKRNIYSFYHFIILTLEIYPNFIKYFYEEYINYYFIKKKNINIKFNVCYQNKNKKVLLIYSTLNIFLLLTIFFKKKNIFHQEFNLI